MKRIVSAIAAGALAVGFTATAAQAASHSKLKEITVAYFLEWPMPFQYAKVMKTYDKKLGVKVNWRSFDAGTAMSAAMASGDVHISVSQGIPPFVVATSAGQDLQIVDVAVSYSDNDNCVVKSSLDIDKSNAKELEGKKVGVPIGTAAHYGFLKQMAHFKVDTSKMNIVDMAPPDGAAAFSQGSLDMVCGWGGNLRKMKKHGNILLTGAEKEKLGIKVFDATTTTSKFAAEHPELLAKFVAITAKMNSLYAKDSSKMLPVIAKDSGMKEDAAADTLKGFKFPNPKEQLSAEWLGGGTQKFLKEVADFFVSTKNIPKARASYDGAVNVEIYKSAEKIARGSY